MRLYRAHLVVAAPVVNMPEPDTVAVANGCIADVGPADALCQRYSNAELVELGDAILLPGFVNAHQHGRGLSQIQLGLPDDMLEPWIARRRGRGAPDIYCLTRLAALEMIRNGVTATLHANYSYGTGDYEAELRDTIRAYIDSGIRATICVGFADRGGLIYPPADESAFRAELSPGAEQLVASSGAAYLPLESTLVLMAKLQEELAGHPRITLAHGPAGPQWVSDQAWRRIAEDASRRDLGIHFHLLESPAQARALQLLYPEGVMARLESLGVFSTRASVAHFTQAGPREIEAAVRLGLAVVANPGANLRLFNGAPAIGSWREAGISVAVGTDNCALDDNEDYLSELRLAALLSRMPSRSPEDARTALRMGTVNGSRAAFQREAGWVAPGMPADLVAISAERARGVRMDEGSHLLDVILARGTGADVVMTMIAGEVLHRISPVTTSYDPCARAAADAARAASHSEPPRARIDAEDLAKALRSHYQAAAT